MHVEYCTCSSRMFDNAFPPHTYKHERSGNVTVLLMMPSTFHSIANHCDVNAFGWRYITLGLGFPQRDTVVSDLFFLFAQSNLQLICLSKTVSESVRGLPALQCCINSQNHSIVSLSSTLKGQSISDCQHVLYSQIYTENAVVNFSISV